MRFTRTLFIAIAMLFNAGAASAATVTEVLQGALDKMDIFEASGSPASRFYLLKDLTMDVKFTLDAEGKVTDMQVTAKSGDANSPGVVKRRLTEALNKASLKNAAGTYAFPVKFEGEDPSRTMSMSSMGWN